MFLNCLVLLLGVLNHNHLGLDFYYNQNSIADVFLTYTRKKTPLKVFSCEFCKFLRKSYSLNHLIAAAFVHYIIKNISCDISANVFKTLSNFYVGVLLVKLVNRHTQLTIFVKMLFHKCLTRS